MTTENPEPEPAPQPELTAEQIKNWRIAMVGMFGPYALIMPEDQIQRLRDNMQEWCDNEAQP